ncbi:MAG TPA: ABC transporter ATP-binding protein [Candidatus Paceibacterota bacterium]|nr:ABC transporter ATP-binding protein [Candidatus Paceibacterota bacterium]
MAKLSNIEGVNKPRSIFSIFWFIIKLSWRNNKWVFSAAVLTTITIVSFQFINSYSFAQIINILTAPNPTWKLIIPFLILIVILDYLPNILGFTEASLTEYIDRSLRIELEQLVYKKISNLDIATIEQPDFQDTLYQINSRGIAGMININFWLFTLIRQGFRVIVSLFILFSLSKLGLLILVLSALPIYIYESWRAKRLGKIFASQTETNRKAGSRVGAFNNKDALIEVKFFGLGNYFLEKIKGIRLNHHKHLSKDDVQTIPLYAGSQLFPQAGILVSIVAVISDVIKGLRPIGTLSFIWSTLWSFSSGFQSILRSIGRLEEHGTYASKLMNMLELQPYVSENKNGIAYDSKISPVIEFKNVSFSYPGSESDVLKNINTIISANSETALVGLNGAGKTTLLRLLSRVYDPTSGDIFVNGINLKDYSLSSWRSALGIMLQDYTVYQDETIKENITFAQGKEDLAFFDKVAIETGVAEYAKSYTDGFNQMIGKEYRGGVELSKGQKQKLVLARTLYQNHPFLILDEPTAAIDALSEDYIFKALRNNHKDQTRVIISHKFSNVRDADQIILIEHGTVIEQGSHDELMKIKKGKYKELFELQAEGYK